MQLSLRPLVLAVAASLYCSASSLQAAPAAWDNLNLLEQAGGLPDDFQSHFFDVPIIVRVERDGQYLGDAKALLSRRNTIELIEFTDTVDSRLPAAERQRWLDALATPHTLGECERDCSNGLQRLHYSLESSLLSLATHAAAQALAADRHHALPEGGSRGLIARNQLNIYGGEGFSTAGRYALDLQGSLGNWSTVARYQADRSGEREAALRHSMQALYAQRELNDHFVRVGYFLPNFQGVTRQPRAPGSPNFTTFGVMAGSSDSLVVDSRASSMYPVYVTANREGMLEIYRDGALIQTQALQPGLQLVDTQRLPGGIYEVELRVIEDGRESSRERSLIHKPSNWRNPEQRWRYSVFAGRQSGFLDSYADPEQGGAAFGGIVNYLAHPRAVVGLSAQQVGGQRAVGGSLDWQANDRFNLYTNAYRATGAASGSGSGVDLQGIWRYADGTVVASHNRSWQERRRYGDYEDWRDRLPEPEVETRAGWLRSSAVAVNHRVGNSGNVSARVSHSTGVSNGLGLDLSFNRRQMLLGSDASWRASVFDRPANASSGQRRNRGVDFTLTVALGRPQRSYSGSLGTRTGRKGRRDLYAGAGVQQRFDDGVLRSLGGQATVDREGLGLGASAFFEHAALRGDAQLQRSSSAGGISGSANLESTVAIGGGRVALAGAALGGATSTGMIVDVESDLPAIALGAYDSGGGAHRLRPGRNFVPVTAYKAGHVQLDFSGRDAPAASIHPSSLEYHLNRGGVAYQRVTVMRTVTVMGYLQDEHGSALGGAHVFNHAGRSVSEAGGFFTLEMSASQPSLEVRHPAVGECRFSLLAGEHPREDDVVMVGSLRCPPGSDQAITRISGEAP
ncbi:TcfC E-set like domain-containing protein [Stenotrophomonas sp. TWI700]|uniref:TcfC E-set like domain-containing protein n=1 Tax=Stenotrophomonas sp. TWI700 TaxID=3136792 RepID=UPI00320BA62D